MSRMRIGTFNVQNLRARRQQDGVRFDGARDADAPCEAHGGNTDARVLDAEDRKLTADLIATAQCDVLALQEVFNQDTLNSFHDSLLIPRGISYPFRVCLEGNDGRSFDVAALSKSPPEKIQSFANLSFADIGCQPPEDVSKQSPIFRRDCLVLNIEGVHFFVCHLKSAPPGDLRSREIRRAEARAIRYVIERSVPDPAKSLWIILGDFNTHTKEDEDDLAPFTRGFSVDLNDGDEMNETWTYYYRPSGAYTRPDRILASPALAPLLKGAKPMVLRMGMGYGASSYLGERLEGVGEQRPHASDHALVFVEIRL